MCLLFPACERTTPGPAPGVAVTVLDLAQAVAPAGNRYAGRVEPITTVQVRSQAEGAVQAVAEIGDASGRGHRLQIGDEVTSGLLLVQIEPDSYQQRLGVEQAKLESAKVQLANERKEYDRAKALYESKVESKEFVDNARTAYEAAQASVAQQRHSVDEARIQLDRTSVKAPLDGVVLKVAVQPGDSVRRQNMLVEIGDVTSVDVTFGVPAAAVAALTEGMLLHMTFDAIGGDDYAAPITRIAPSADTRSGVFDVTLTLPNPDGVLRPGFVAEVRVPRELLGDASVGGLTVPLDAIVRPPNRPSAFGVYVVESASDAKPLLGTARLREVVLGAPIGNRVAVRGGLTGDERVIVRGSTLVHDGAAVRVIP